MSEFTLVPKLRFNEFSDKWRTYLINEVCKINPRSENLPDSFIYIDLESVTDGVLLSKNRVFKVDAPSRAQRLLKKNDILYQTVRPYQKNNLFFDKNDLDYVSSTGYAQIRTNEVPKFIFQYLLTNRFVNKILSKCTGTSYPSINSSDLGTTEINLPQVPEQQKIASFLSSVDKKIDQLQQKKSLLEQYKKGVMQQLFSQQLRFKNDDGNDYPDWEEKKLGDISNYVKGYAFKSVDYINEGVPIVRVSDLLSNKIKSDNEKVYLSPDKAKQYDKYKLIKGNIIITTVGSKPEMVESAVGRGIYISNDDEGLLNQNMLKLEKSQKINNAFLINLINSKRYQAYMKSIARGNANQANITVVDLLKFKIQVPVIEEQTKIANFLSAIDTKIESVNIQIETTQQFKKGLLQQMFV